MNNYNKFNNQQNSEESTLAETILLAGSGLFLIWVGTFLSYRKSCSFLSLSIYCSTFSM